MDGDCVVTQEYNHLVSLLHWQSGTTRGWQGTQLYGSHLVGNQHSAKTSPYSRSSFTFIAGVILHAIMCIYLHECIYVYDFHENNYMIVCDEKS